MTTIYQAQDQSPHGGSPYELFKFTSEAGPLFYTSNASPVAFGDDIYYPIQISRGLIEVGGVADSPATYDINLPVSSALFALYGLALTPPTLGVEIYRQQRNASGFRRQSVGTCVGHSVEDNTYTLQMQNTIQTQVNAAVALVIFDNKCNNIFGDVRCKYDVEGQTIDANITAATDFVLTVDADMVASKYRGGTLEIGGQTRLIMDNDAHTLTVAYPFLRADGITACSIAPGCDLSRTNCLAYDNIDNFSGFQAIPTDNPLSSDLNKIQTDFAEQKTQTDTSRFKPLYGNAIL